MGYSEIFKIAKTKILVINCFTHIFMLEKKKKKRFKNNLSSEGLFYQSEWVKINSSWVTLFFHFMCDAVNASELFCMAQLANNECFFTPF